MGDSPAPARRLVSRQEIGADARFNIPEAPALSEQKPTARKEAPVEDIPPGHVQKPEIEPPATSHAICTTAAVPATLSSQACPDETEASGWRDEISERLSRYRSRRKIRPPRYPSLRLPFVPLEAPGSIKTPGAGSVSNVFEPVSDHALALDGMTAKPAAAAVPDARSTQEQPAGVAPQAVSPSSSGAKILEFPRFAWGPPPPPADQLAEPVSDRPRILEVPEVAPPPPALGGITIETDENPGAEKRPGIEVPLQSAPLARRVLAGVIDGLIIAVASALFGVIFRKVAAIRPPLIQILGLTTGIPCVLWAAYQYLLIVYAGSTPGLRAVGLELACFDGNPARRSLRRWRVLASFLSGASLGMGFVWALLDEDALCWHDRITHTYLAPRKHAGGDPQISASVARLALTSVSAEGRNGL